MKELSPNMFKFYAKVNPEKKGKKKKTISNSNQIWAGSKVNVTDKDKEFPRIQYWRHDIEESDILRLQNLRPKGIKKRKQNNDCTVAMDFILRNIAV